MSWQRLFTWRKRDGEGAAPRRRGVLFLGAALVAVTAMVLFGGYAWANKSVLLVLDGKEASVQTFARTVGGVLEAEKVVLLEKDEVAPALDTPLEDGMVVTVSRANAIQITLDGKLMAARARGETVRDVLGEFGINLGPKDEVTPVMEARVVPDMEIKVARLRTETQVDEAPIEYNTKKQYTTSLPQGSTRVAREGREGTERRTWQVAYRGGLEVNRQLASREVVTPAVDKVVMVGSGMVVSRGGKNIRYSEAIDMLASAYSHTGSNTASGVYPHYGVAAVDTSRIPIGTRLYVEGYGYATALDRGSAIKGNRIDLFFESHSEAMKWGLKRVKVYRLD